MIFLTKNLTNQIFFKILFLDIGNNQTQLWLSVKNIQFDYNSNRSKSTNPTSKQSQSDNSKHLWFCYLNFGGDLVSGSSICGQLNLLKSWHLKLDSQISQSIQYIRALLAKRMDNSDFWLKKLKLDQPFAMPKLEMSIGLDQGSLEFEFGDPIQKVR